MLREIVCVLLIISMITGCSKQENIAPTDDSVDEAIFLNMASSSATLKIPEEKPIPEISEEMTAESEVYQDQELLWSKDEPFGQAIEHAAVALYEIYNDPDYASVFYSVGLADFNLDGIPELIVGSHGNWGGGINVFDVTEERHRYIGYYWVPNGEPEFSIVRNLDTGEEFFRFSSKGGHGSESYDCATYFTYSGGTLDSWSIRKDQLFDDKGNVYEKYDEVSHNGLIIEDKQEVDDFYSKWANKDWDLLSGPGIENRGIMFPAKNPDEAREWVYSLAKNYLELEIRKPIS